MTTTTTRTTTTTMTGNSVLLFCAALLMSMSCGILAQSDVWSETTTVSEGSGWEITIISTDLPEYTTVAEELTTPAIEELDTTTAVNTEDGGKETTLSPNEPEPEPETTVQPNEDPSNAGPGGQEQEGSGSTIQQSSTSSPSEEQSSSASPSEEQSSTAGAGEEQSSSSSPTEEQSSSPSPSEGQSSSPSPSEEPPLTTEVEPIAPTPPPVFECKTIGPFPDINGDCQRYHNCVLDPLTGGLLNLEMICPPLLAFSPKYGRCVRDVSSCTNDEFVCVNPGRFAGTDDSYYYNCVFSLQGGFHKYVVRCSAGHRFDPLLRRCWRNDWSQLYPGQSLEASDLAAIKREQKEFKVEEKLRLKAAKLAEKDALKQQKLEEKLAKKAAKEQAKKEAKEAKEKAKGDKPISLESAESPEQTSLGN